MSLFSFNFFIEESNDLVCIVGNRCFFKEINPAFVKHIKRRIIAGTFSIFSTSKDLERSLHEIGSLANGKLLHEF
jgi:hypothetical protein